MTLRGEFSFRASLFCNLTSLFRRRIQCVGQELLSQQRPVGDDAGFVVDKRYAVDTARGIDAEYSVNAVFFKQLSEFVPRIVRAHGVFDCLSQLVERSRFFRFVFRHPVILLKAL